MNQEAELGAVVGRSVGRTLSPLPSAADRQRRRIGAKEAAWGGYKVSLGRRTRRRRRRRRRRKERSVGRSPERRKREREEAPPAFFFTFSLTQLSLLGQRGDILRHLERYLDLSKAVCEKHDIRKPFWDLKLIVKMCDIFPLAA